MKRIVLAVLVSATTAAADAPKEHAELVKLLGAQLDCTGSMLMGPKVALTGTMKEELDLGGAWVHESFVGTAGKEKAMFDAHLTFDDKAKQWTRLEMSSRGGYTIAHAPALANNKLDWDSDITIPSREAMKSKTHLDLSDAKAVHVKTELSLDGGKTYVPLIEMTCKKH